MKLREVIVKNFRGLADVRIPICDTTVLIGENNTGKTTLLEALKIMLPRSSIGRESVFGEYDYHMVKLHDSARSCEGIILEAWFREDAPDEWPDSLIQALDPIIQTDPIDNLDSIGLRLSSRYDESETKMVTKWEFLTSDGLPVAGTGESRHLTRFLSYVRCFYLSSLRDPAHEFSPQSQFWGRILRDLKISDEQRQSLLDILAKLNEQLLTADPRLEQVRATLDQGQGLTAIDTGQKTSIQALPLKPWDLMSKAEIAIKARGSAIDFPLACHGQGAQSLAVLFLFQAYIDVLLKPTFQPETEAVLALEEPEAHLHPQAIRALAANLNQIKSQKIISSHSPYFIQELPLTQVRLFRREGSTSKVLYVKRSFSTQVPSDPNLSAFCANNPSKFTYDERKGALTVKGRLEENEYREIVALYPGQADVHAAIKQLRKESQLFLSEADLIDLEVYVKRFRGEALFAHAWLLCEGQSEYAILRYFAELLGVPLDQAGICVIDYQNNGAPGAFVRLARSFETPWIMLCDKDDAGRDFVTQVKKCGLTDHELLLTYRLTDQALTHLAASGVPHDVLTKLETLKEQTFANDEDFSHALDVTIGADQAKAFRVQILEDAQIRPPVRLFPGDRVDLELFLYTNGFADEFKFILEETARELAPHATEWIIAEDSRDRGADIRKVVVKDRGEYQVRLAKKGCPDTTIVQSDETFEQLVTETVVAELRKQKVRNALALIERLRTEGASKARIPKFFSLAIKDIIAKAA